MQRSKHIAQITHRALLSVGNVFKLIITVLVLVLSSTASGQTILLVHGDNGLTIAQGATGFDWDHAFKYLPDAIEEAESTNPPVEIWVAGSAAGIHYYPDEGNGIINDDQDKTFRLLSGVTILGGFLEDDDQVTDRDPFVNRVILTAIWKRMTPQRRGRTTTTMPTTSSPARTLTRPPCSTA
jgi:hypothetical protein